MLAPCIPDEHAQGSYIFTGKPFIQFFFLKFFILIEVSSKAAHWQVHNLHNRC
jgi:hypothetical protein